MREDYEKPVTTEESGPMGGTRTTHPCYGQIRASRVTGGTYLYGSAFHHNQYVTISISRSEVRRDLSRDWFFDKDEIVEVALSEAQWATFVSSMNIGGGPPCTVQHVGRERVPQLPAPEKYHDKFDAEMRERLCKAEERLRELRKQISEEKSLSGKKKDALLGTLGSAERDLSPNVKFVAEQFEEHMEETVEKAKMEVEAYLGGAVQRAGLTALKEKPVIQIGESE